MSKPVNLTDMLMQRAEGPAAERAMQAKGPKARASHRSPEALLPDLARAAEAPAREAKSPAKSFQERMKESQTRLSRKEHAFFKQPGNRDAQAGARDAQMRAAQGMNHADRAARPERPAGAEARDRAEATGHETTPRAAKAQGERTEEARPAREGRSSKEAAKTAGSRAGRKAVAPESSEAVAEASEETATMSSIERPAALAAEAPVDLLALDLSFADAESGERSAETDALLAKLEDLGLAATPEQLRDPAFLAEMLWMIDDLPMASPLFEGAAAGAVPGDATEITAFAAAADEAAPAADALLADASEASFPAAARALPAEAVPAAEADWTVVPEAEREEVAALIREKLGQLADPSGFRAGPEGRSLDAPAARLESQAMSAARLAASPAAADAAAKAPAAAPGDLALSDPDRLRVLQGAALAGPAREGLVLPEDPDSGADLTWDSESESVLSPAALRESGEGEGQDGESLPDLMGRNPQAASEPSAARDNAGARETLPAAFQAAMDRTRGAEARPAPDRPLPQQAPVHEQTVLAQIARKVSALATRGTEEIRIQLEPEHLGRVRIAIEMRDGGMTARIAVENEAVRQAVDQNLASLRESLEGQGVKLQGLEVSVDQRHASLFNPDGSNAREFFQRRGQGGEAASPEAEPAESAEADTGRRLGYNTLEFIA